MASTTPKKILVSRQVEQYSRALREAAGNARIDGTTSVVWQIGEGEHVTYTVAGKGYQIPGGKPLVEIAPA